MFPLYTFSWFMHPWIYSLTEKYLLRFYCVESTKRITTKISFKSTESSQTIDDQAKERKADSYKWITLEFPNNGNIEILD
jgi:hypothetical protein